MRKKGAFAKRLAVVLAAAAVAGGARRCYSK